MSKVTFGKGRHRVSASIAIILQLSGTRVQLCVLCDVIMYQVGTVICAFVENQNKPF